MARKISPHCPQPPGLIPTASVSRGSLSTALYRTMWCACCCFLVVLTVVTSNPSSKPFVAFRTNPLDQPVDHAIDWENDGGQKTSKIVRLDHVPSTACALSFQLGISKRAHLTARGIPAAVTIHPVHPQAGPGRQVVYTTQYEHLNVLTPAPLATPGQAIKEALVEHYQFPLLLEGSSFSGTPVVHDFNADGHADVAIVDYNGGLTLVGLSVHHGTTTRYLHHAQVPRLHVRREWLARRIAEELPATEPPNAATNATTNQTDTKQALDDPYHSYFEYAWSNSNNKEDLLRGVPANLLQQDPEQVEALQARRQRRILPQGLEEESLLETGEFEGEETDQEGIHGRRLDEMLADADDLGIPVMVDDDVLRSGEETEKEEEQEEGVTAHTSYHGDDDYRSYHDDFAADDPDYGRDMYDDYMGYNAEHEEYYDSKHYLRIPPHVLSDPVLAELPKLYQTGNTYEVDSVLFMAVSYYLDEDEYQGYFTHRRFSETDKGDETEARRGAYVASALVAYIAGESSSRWSTQQHLDLSTDFTAPENVTIVGALPMRADTSRMGAFALASPTVADFNGDGNLKVLVPTSMGMIYCFDARQAFKRDKWPIQLNFPIESRILVEDVMGDTNLEIFVADTGGNILCLDPNANRLWNRNILQSLSMDSLELTASSPMTMGDVNGDGVLDIVAIFQIRNRVFVFGLDASTGADLEHFPIELERLQQVEDEELHQKLPQPLLVDLHGDQRHVQDYIRRNATKWTPRTLANWHGGSAPGLHIVQPVGERLYIIEAGSGCVQEIDMGDSLEAMVQVDDVHGNGKLDLVVATKSGNVVTLETPSPYHPLNVWNHGATRNRMGGFSHGYSASQGIFVHLQSRQYIDVFGVYVQVTFEIFDNRPGIAAEPDKRKYKVQIRDGTSPKRILFQREYSETGVRTERVYIRYGPGYYSLNVMMRTSHGLVYEDVFHVGYNVNFMDGFGLLLLLPLLLASTAVLLCGSKRVNWDEDDFDEDRDESGNLGILGRALPYN